MKELLEEIELHSKALPDSVQREVLDFIKFKEQKLKQENHTLLEVSMLSESALSQWNNKEEDDAWSSYQ